MTLQESTCQNIDWSGNRSDYEDFYICSISDTKKLVSDAALFLNTVTTFLETQYL